MRQLLDSASADTLVVGEGRAVDLAAAAEEVVAGLAPFAISRGVDLELVTEAGARRAVGEREAIALAIANLVENAVLHGGRGRQVRVTVGPGPVVAVRDRGGGLPDGAADALFRPFWRGTDAPAGGAGLGLAIVERVQRAHGGTVEARNAEGGGAVFRLTYRAAPAAA